MNSFDYNREHDNDEFQWLTCKCGGELKEGTLTCRDCGIVWPQEEEWMRTLPDPNEFWKDAEMA